MDKRFEKCGWHPAEEPPKTDKEGISDYILISYENYPLPDIGQYREEDQGGAYYPGDDDRSCTSYGLFVNGWSELPEVVK